MATTHKMSYNDIGPIMSISIQLKYEDFVVFEYPESCHKCPVGFGRNDCGRNVPFKPEDMNCRPTTCKLIRVNPLELFGNSDQEV